jgi:hypothetical protein
MNEIVKFVRVNWDRCLAGAAVALGAIALLLGMRGVRDSAYVAQQLPYFISGGLIGIFFLGIGMAAWLSADLRDEWRELRALREQLDGELGEPTTAADAARPARANRRLRASSPADSPS